MKSNLVRELHFGNLLTSSLELLLLGTDEGAKPWTEAAQKRVSIAAVDFINVIEGGVG